MKPPNPWGPSPEEGLPDAENWRRVVAFNEWLVVEERKALKDSEHFVAEAEAKWEAEKTPGLDQALAAFRSCVQTHTDVIAIAEGTIAKLKAKLAAVPP